MFQPQLDGTKYCRGCGEDKPPEAFYRDRSTRSGLAAYCTPCKTAYLRRHIENDPERFKAKARVRARRHRRRKEYGLTDTEFAALVAEHESTCCICGVAVSDDSPEHNTRLVVDHDHATGKVRGILCDPCNTGLGRFRDDPALLVAAANYLLRER